VSSKGCISMVSQRGAAGSQRSLARRRAGVTAGLALVTLGGGCAALLFGSISVLGVGRLEAAAALISPLPSPSLKVLPTASLPAVTALPTATLPPLPVPTATPSLPAVTPLPSATLPPLPVPTPTPSLPPLPVSASPSPSLPPLGTTPTPTISPLPGNASGQQPGDGSGSSGGGPSGGFPIPYFGRVTPSPLDIALLSAVGSLPLLFGIWFLLFGRTYAEARRSRDAQIRLAIAHDLGLSPRELSSVTTTGLFKLREEAGFDELTGVLRRATGISALDREVSRARRQRTPLSVAFIDIDGLKHANDKRGHQAGDELLRGLASLLKAGLRGQDLVLRYGGDEFVCVLPDTVGDAARAKMSWIQTEAEKSGFGFSCGVAQLERSDDLVSLLGRADTEMYAVKARRAVVRDLRLGVVGGSTRRESA